MVVQGSKRGAGSWAYEWVSMMYMGMNTRQKRRKVRTEKHEGYIIYLLINTDEITPQTEDLKYYQ